jgi:hypothetical protein
MSKKRKGATPSPQDASEGPAQPTIHEAELASGPSGAVEYGAEIDSDMAVTRRRAGGDVVVRGNDLRANRTLARAIESAVGPCERQDPHDEAGPNALPHFQPAPRPPEGHTFYETQQRKARRKR